MLEETLNGPGSVGFPQYWCYPDKVNIDMSTFNRLSDLPVLKKRKLKLPKQNCIK